MLLRIVPFEIRKLLEQPVIYLFFIASLLLNVIYITTAGFDQSYLNYIHETQVQTGTRVTDEFRNILSEATSSKKQQRLLRETAEVKNIFQDYSTEYLGQEMIDFYQINGTVAEKIKRKYERLTPVIEQLSETQAALEVGAAGETMSFFTFVTNRLFRTILGESLIFSLLLGLYGSTFEKLTKTDTLVMSSKTGRRTQVSKYLASLFLSMFFYVLMIVLTFSVFKQIYDFGTLWQTSISTQFHQNIYAPQMLQIPFIPWQPMTLLRYTILSMGLGSVFVFLCHGFNFFIGLWVDNLFRGFTVFVVIYAIVIGLEQIRWSELQALLMWHPISIWRVQAHWFTEMGPYSTIPWQESIASGVNIVLLVIFGLFTSKFYATKEVK